VESRCERIGGNLDKEHCHSPKKGRALRDFCPDGYLRSQHAILRAAGYWFPERFAALERAAGFEAKPDNSMGAAVRAFSQPQFPDALEEIAIQAVRQLRNLLHQGKLHGYYFGHWGRQSVSCEFWATADANGILERAVYWPLGRPSSLYEQRPNCPLFVLRSELDALLSAEPAKKRSLPRSKIPELVAALCELGDLQNRQLQYAALCELPQFREFKITRADFREAARHLPRKGGRKSRQK
jgi:hypothetical protein